ncbi:DNA topoisomerase III, partial [Crocinitomix catalasitica]|nr:DNA topoisomerase III [Crocinitomix catalasitica]
KPVKRLWISSLTEEAIKEGFEKLRDGKDFTNLYAAGSARAVGDWLLGMNATRLYTLKYGKNKQVLSIGRVQTPTLAMIVERQLGIEGFKSQKYWELKTHFKEVLFSATAGRIDEKEKAEQLIESIKEKEFEVVSYEQKEGKEQPPRLFDLTSLQVEANNKFSFSADNTLKQIQGLYEKKLVTYPRVDTTFLSEDIYPKVPKIMAGLKHFSKLTEPLMNKPFRKSKKVFNDKKVTDHHAIIPTGVAPSGISPDEQKIYRLVTIKFISVFYPDCLVSNTTVLGKVEISGAVKGGDNNIVEFKASGKQILEPGWRVVYEEPASSNSAVSEGSAAEGGSQKEGKEENFMPTFEEGEKGPHEAEIQEKETRPPKYFTEATLLRAMETAGKNVEDEDLREAMKENGIGRPSTRANIIETLFRRKYIEKKKKNLHATVTGISLINTIQSDELKSAELTGQWEYKLRLIEKGEYDVATFKKELIQMVVDITNRVKSGDGKVTLIDEVKQAAGLPSDEAGKQTVVGMTCPKCSDSKLLKGKMAYGCGAYKDGCDFILPFEILGKKLSEKNLLDLLVKGKTSRLKGFQMQTAGETKGESKAGKLVLTKDFNLELE